MPVIVFLHGFTATDPDLYRAWIDHLVRRGSVVIYPDYQESGLGFGRQDDYVPNMLAGIASALEVARLAPTAVHLVGHSLGGVLGVAYLVEGPATGLPGPATLTVLTPGGCKSCPGGVFGVSLPETIDPQSGLLLHIVTGADDTLVGDRDARAIDAILSQVPDGQRRALEVVSDRYGEPDLVADHRFPQTGGFRRELDALDWYGLWRPLDALIACATAGQLCDIALGVDPASLSMGRWSNGTPVTIPVLTNWS
jgi:pimeloyl-ACP methyl ester carboxylesterase